LGLAWLLAATACVHRPAAAGRSPSSAPSTAKPRVSASVTAAAPTSEWRSVVSPTRLVTPAPPVAPVTVTDIKPAMAVTAPAPVASGAVDASTNRMISGAPAGFGALPTVSDQPMGYKLRVGDPVVINLRGILPRDEEIECLVDEGGFVKVPYLERIKASGLSTSQLEDEIERRYIDGKIYKSISVGVIMPSQSYFIQGEVKVPGRVILLTPVTLLQAIAQAGGYTDYADEGDVRIIRAGRTQRHNAKDLSRYPERDVRIEPGDVINVTRSPF
jgi:protein involved in polysaccharide export with SLBB domain